MPFKLPLYLDIWIFYKLLFFNSVGPGIKVNNAIFLET